MDPPSKQMKVFQCMIKSSRFRPVLCYYSGFTKLADPAIRKLIYTYSQNKSHFKDVLPLLHCLFEAQQPSLCQLVESHFDYITFSSFTPVDHLVIGYVIASILSTSTFNQKKIYLDLEYSNDHKVKLLLIGLSYYPVGGQTIAGAALARRLALYINVNETTTCKAISLIADHLKSSSSVISELTMNLDVNVDDNENSFLSLIEALQRNTSLAKLST